MLERSTEFFISMTAIAPRILSSSTWGSAVAALSSLLNCSSINVTFAFQSVANSSLMEAWATAQAKGFAIKVGPCINVPGVPLEIVFAT